MAALKEPVKIFIVQALACRDTLKKWLNRSSKSLELILVVANVNAMIQQNIRAET